MGPSPSLASLPRLASLASLVSRLVGRRLGDGAPDQAAGEVPGGGLAAGHVAGVPGAAEAGRGGRGEGGPR
eukprot:CAMPEP_0172602750 /NCGR_PEP_ID=MMETSP1068-20121228/22936_1 /TAXON_ID=35684 /ORGANISM="Pseudopedinella elastica, Strain CCMP716" /LENGTH=70 /DNA_ID=CAMNT_0013404221 /DNA_START=218 /DNA_END=427 /DNA_ORIENTATION=+